MRVDRQILRRGERGRRRRLNHSDGFTLLEIIGVLAVIATLLSILLPNVIDQMDRAARNAEPQTLRAIGQGVEAYVRQNRTWPAAISGLSPEFVPFGDEQLLKNQRGFTRYLTIHPDATPYTNGNGIDSADLSDYRFMVITDLTQDVSPVITNASQFDTWWDTDDSVVPDLLIHRGTIKRQLHLVSLNAVGVGGSYRIDGQATDSGGGTLTGHGQLHVTDTLIELSEDDTFAGGSGVTVSFTLQENVGYQWSPSCAAGAKWHALGTAC